MYEYRGKSNFYTSFTGLDKRTNDASNNIISIPGSINPVNQGSDYHLKSSIFNTIGQKEYSCSSLELMMTRRPVAYCCMR